MIPNEVTNQMTLSPGTLNQCRLRWNIEKAIDQQEQKLDERKAWTASESGKSASKPSPSVRKKPEAAVVC